MTDRTDAVARMLETIDLLAKMTASISDRLDRQDRDLADVKRMIQEARKAISTVQAQAVTSSKVKQTEAELLHLALADLKQKTTDLRALYAEADRYFDRVKQEAKSERRWSQRPWGLLLLLTLVFGAGLAVGMLV